MSNISKIKITKKSKAIPVNFELEIKNFTVITGENNSGKTSFMQAIDNGDVIYMDATGVDISEHVDIPVYIPAEFIMGDENLKIGKKSYLITSLKEIISGDPSFKLKTDEHNHTKNILDVVQVVNDTINHAIGDKNNSIKISVNEEVSLKEILDSVLNIEPLDYSSGKVHKKFEEIGQGWQRLIIIAFILAVEKQKQTNGKIRLILLEEPEVYLHPKLKRAMNKMLNVIASKTNNQVIITTHDPYFALTHVDELDNVVYSFTRNNTNNDTMASPANVVSGIEDELLHIFLFTKLMQDLAKKGISMDNLGNLNKYLLSQVGMVQKQYYWPNSTIAEPMALPLYIRNQIHHPDNLNTVNKKNSFSGSDLEESIKILNNLLK